MPPLNILDIGFIFAFMFLTLLFLTEYFAYSKTKFALFIDIDKTRKLAMLYGIIFITCAIIYISIQIWE